MRSTFFTRKFWRCIIISKNELMTNEEIRDKEVRLIDSDGTMLGIYPIAQAQNMARVKELDLVKIAPQAEPPVCKIMDYGKHIFELGKREKEAKKNQKVMSVKGIRLSPYIESHDFQFKLKNAIKFLKSGDKVKVTLKFRGREMSYTALGEDILLKFADGVSEVGVIDKAPKLD